MKKAVAQSYTIFIIIHNNQKVMGKLLIFFREYDMIPFKEKGVAAIDLEIKTVFLDSGT